MFSERLYARPPAVSDVFDGSSSAHAAGSAFWFVWAWRLIGAVAWPGPRYVLQGLCGGRAGRAGRGTRPAGPPARTPPSPAPVGAGGGQNLVDRLVHRFSGGDRRGWYGTALAACDGGPAGGPAGAGRTGAARRLPLRDLSGGGPPPAGRRLWRHGGAAPVSRRHRDVPLAHLPSGLDGLRIVHLSDLHIGDFMPRAAIRRAVDLANA